MDKKQFKELIIVMLTSILVVLLLTGCSKEEITPGNYTAGTVIVGGSNNWQANFQNGGVLPTWGSNSNSTNN
jgi:hypothetical protein